MIGFFRRLLAELNGATPYHETDEAIAAQQAVAVVHNQLLGVGAAHRATLFDLQHREYLNRVRQWEEAKAEKIRKRHQAARRAMQRRGAGR